MQDVLQPAEPDRRYVSAAAPFGFALVLFPRLAAGNAVRTGVRGMVAG